MSRPDRYDVIPIAMSLLVIAFALACCLGFVYPGPARGAPAPLPSRDRSSLLTHPRPPLLCEMHWSSGRYRTTFSGEGEYLAVPLNAGLTWRGFWHVKRGERGYVLHIKERSSEESGWLEWEVPFAEALSLGGTKTLGGLTEVRLAPWTGGVEQ